MQIVGIVLPGIETGLADCAGQCEKTEFDAVRRAESGDGERLAVEWQLEILPGLAAADATSVRAFDLRESGRIAATGTQMRIFGTADFFGGLVVHHADTSVPAVTVDPVDARDDFITGARKQETIFRTDDLPFRGQLRLNGGEVRETLDGAVERDLNRKRGMRTVGGVENRAHDVRKSGREFVRVGAGGQFRVLGECLQRQVQMIAEGTRIGREEIVGQRRGRVSAASASGGVAWAGAPQGSMSNGRN